jgi:monoamine oxidase
MTNPNKEVVIVGGGAAGVAATRRLHDAKVPCLLVEARPRLGGRAWTVPDAAGHTLDLGCGWLHSADRNPWTEIAQRQGRMIDKTAPPWERSSLERVFPLSEQREFFRAQHEFDARLEKLTDGDPDRPSSAFLEPGNRWNAMIDAVSTYYSGVELDRLSARDLNRYREGGINWRVSDGYGTAIAAHGDGVPVMLDCPVTRIDHSGKRLKIETAKGAIAADYAIVTLPTPALADEALFSPALPDKAAAAAGLPLGLADKLFMKVDAADEFEKDSRLFGHTDRTGTGTYHMRPFGRPLIEAYFGGSHAQTLETQGEDAFFDFAVSELTGAFGSDFARRIKPVRVHGWASDPFARGSYSYAMPGKADCRAALAAPVDGRLFFAGEACSLFEFSTAHGAYATGVDAAEAVITALDRRRS